MKKTRTDKANRDRQKQTKPTTAKQRQKTEENLRSRQR